MNNITFFGEKILQDKRELFSLPFYINDIVIFNKLIIVLRESFAFKYAKEVAIEHYEKKGIPLNRTISEENEANEDYNNVYAYDYNGNLTWRIEPMDDWRTNEFRPYSGIYKVNDKLALYHPSGIEVLVNPETGKVISKEFIK